MTIKKIYQYISLRPKYLYLIIFVFIFLLFGIFQLQPTFGDPDAFYHIKISQMMMKGQLTFDQFPWMQYSTLNTHFTDHHFLYHLFLIPFLYIGGLVWGTKLAIAFLAASFVTTLYWFMKKFQFQYIALTISALLLFSSFFFRLSLVKATPISLIIILLLITFILEKKYWWLTILSYVYVLCYGGWLLGLFIALVYIFSNTIFFITQQTPKVKKIVSEIFKQDHLKIVGAITIGNILGIIINPYFPKNLTIFWQQIIDIGVINYGNIIQVGNEWYSTSALSIITSTRFLFVLLVIGILLAVFNRKKINRQAIFFFSLTAIFFILTMKSRRYLEYYGPFAAILAGYLLTLYKTDLKQWLHDILQKKDNPFHRAIFLVVCVLLIFMVLAQTKSMFELTSTIPVTKFEQASLFLKNKTPYHSIVMHDNWDEWPLLFFHNTNDYYIAGLDPTFAYKYDASKYLRWREMVNGPADENFYLSIKNDFQADYVFASKQYKQFVQNLENNIYFQPVYEDDDVIIYQVL